MGRVCSRR